ncbi:MULTISPECIES: hypothetical protein [Natrialbaceae]|uniref:hypothetical protein n=1 Tax=Natrialbaceae TaxID=1644061 RepID=UPI00207C4276|nr:hypothetical protein [Natronococcus sp. CG52]
MIDVATVFAVGMGASLFMNVVLLVVVDSFRRDRDGGRDRRDGHGRHTETDGGTELEEATDEDVRENYE